MRQSNFIFGAVIFGTASAPGSGSGAAAANADIDAGKKIQDEISKSPLGNTPIWKFFQ